MNNFKNELNKKIRNSIKNEYGVENYDEYRFGTYPIKLNIKNSEKLLNVENFKKIIKKIIGYHPEYNAFYKLADNLVDKHITNIDKVWKTISTKDKKLFVSLIAYMVLGYKKVKLPLNTSDYWKAIEKAKTLANSEDKYDPKFMHFILEKFDLNPIGYNIKLYFSEIGIAIDYIIEQYAYKLGNENIVYVEEGDTVLDIGGCWGDTALYFAHRTGKNGKVYSFEFIPENIKLFKINTAFNEHLINQIQLIEQPVSDKSGYSIYFKDFGPGSKVAFEPFEGQTGTCKTISIDDFVESNTIQNIDFIKMDIEGSETAALNGAIETIKKFRPKLAIAIYHSMDDLVNIPTWILNLDLDYEIFMGHYTIHAEETICFAKPKINNQ